MRGFFWHMHQGTMLQSEGSEKMYNIGDRLVYPMHGAGVVEAIEEKDFLDEKKFYYVLKMPIGDVKVMIPVNNASQIGIRDVSTKEIAEEVLQKFIETEADTASNWNKRYRENMEKIKSGELIEIAYVAKTLMLKEKMKGLSMGERKMLQSVKQILTSELVISLNSTSDDMADKLQAIVMADIERLEAEAAEVAEVKPSVFTIEVAQPDSAPVVETEAVEEKELVEA